MENQQLRKRLYQNLSQKPIKHNFLLDTESKDTKSTGSLILKPRILQDSIGELKGMQNSVGPNSPLMSKSPDLFEKKKLKVNKVDLEKLSKEGKFMIEDGKNKGRANLKPNEIFAFYDSFPEMVEDFFYLNRMNHPYDYQIVSYAKRNHHEYMTISSQGVTLYHDKEAEFLTREEWLEDEKTYFELQKIDFFSQYKISKNFMIWKNKMKRHYMKSMSNILCEKLFLTSEHPRKCLKEIREISLCLEDSLTFFPSEHLESIGWSELLDITNKYQTNSLINKVEEFEKKIIRSLEDAIDLEIKNFKENNKIKIDGLNSNEENKEGYIYSQEAILRKQYKRVLKLIKLAESVLLESKIHLIKRWLTQVLEKLKEVNESTQRDEWLTINFVALPPANNESEINWNPSYENFIQTFKIIVSKAVNVICEKHQKIMNNPIFEKYRNQDEASVFKDDRHNSMKFLIEESNFYNNLISQIEDRLETEFKWVEKQEEDLKKFIEIYTKHKNMPSLENIIKESTVAEISSLAREWKQDNIQMQDLPDKFFGMIRFDYSLMRKSMSNVANASYTEMFSILPLHLSRLCIEIENEANELLKPLNIIPTDTNFVSFTKAVKRASEDVESVIEGGKEIKQLLFLLEDNKSPNLEIYKTNIKNLMSLLSELSSKVHEAEAKQDQRLSKFKKDIEITIKKIKASVKEFSVKLEQIELDQKDLTSDVIIERIGVILPVIIDLDKQAKEITNVECELSLNETNFSEAHDLDKRVKVLDSLWNQKKLWSEFTNVLYECKYWEMDCDKEKEKWGEFEKEISSIKPFLEDNEFLISLMEEINEVETQIELVRSLQSKSLNEKSWNEISEYLTFEFEKKEGSLVEAPFKNPKDDIYNVRWLKDNEVCKCKEKIELIVKKSENESNLTNVLTIIKTYIHSLSLQFVSKKRELVLLGDNQIVFKELSDHLECLLDTFKEEYSESFKKETKTLVKHYEYVIEILEHFRDFGKNWEKYEELFEPSKHYSKQLGKESKDFANLETNWKKIIKNMVVENWSKRINDEVSGPNPSRNTLKAIYKANVIWEHIKKGIEEFLDKRRTCFPHYFYFCDDELLTFMTKVESCCEVNSVAPIIFENVKSINLNKETDILNSIVNTNGEEFKVNRLINCKITSELEEVLKSCEDQWKKSLLSTIKKVFVDFVSLNDEEVSRKKLILENITQVALAFDHIVWVKLAEETYLCNEPLGTLNDWISIQNGQIADLFDILKMSINCTEHRKITQVIIQSIYLRDKTEHFHSTHTESLESYEWERTLKLCDGTGNLHEKIFLKVFNSIIYYGGEILGLSNSTYIAPETEKSFLSLSQVIHDREVGIINQNSHIETIKALGYLVAQSFKIFNFCEKVNYKIIDRVLAGICYQGTWACITPPCNWEAISFIASHLSQIEKCVNENTFAIQLSKYPITINQHNLPVFFLKVSDQELEYLQKIPKTNYRSISLITPNLKTVLSIESEVAGLGSKVGETVAELSSSVFGILKNRLSDLSKVEFCLKIVREFIEKQLSAEENINKNVADIIMKTLNPRLTVEDQNTVINYFQAYNIESDQKHKIKKYLTTEILPTFKELVIDEEKCPYGESITHDAATLLKIINETENERKIALVGPSFYGKTSIIEYTKNYIEKKEKKKIYLESLYFEAFREDEILLSTEKHQGMIAKIMEKDCDEAWLVLDGPINDKYLTYFANLSKEFILSNFGVVRSSQFSKKLRVFFESNNILHVTPRFVNDHSILYIKEKSSRVEEIVKNGLLNYTYKTFEEHCRTEIKNDESQHEIKSYISTEKSVGLSKDSLESLISQIIVLIEKFVSKGFVKIKSVELMYELSASELAYKCTQLTQKIFNENWDSIKEKDKITKKTLEKFSTWVVVWSISALVSGEDREKFQKSVCEMLKTNDDFVNEIVFPGGGLEIVSLTSARAQSSLSSLPIIGDITNIINSYNELFDGNNPVPKNKFESEFFFDDPNNIRVVTPETVMFSYLNFLNKRNKTPIAIYGAPCSGKRSIIDAYNKINQQKVETYQIRFKSHDPYFISKQVIKSFVKFEGYEASYLKPFEISKLVHISIEDVCMTPATEPAAEFIRMLTNEKRIYDEKANSTYLRQYSLTLTLRQIQFFNQEQVDFKRVLSRLSILQNSPISKEKLTTIFTPILDNLCCQFWSSERMEPGTSKSIGENILVEATTSIYTFIENLSKELPCKTISERNNKLLLTPKIKEFCNSVTNLCQIEEPNKNKMGNYAEMWAHEVIRVFGDKLETKEGQESLIEEIKKACFMQFKHNLSISNNGFIFTDLCQTEEGLEKKEENNPYARCEDLGEIEKEIQRLYDGENIPLAAPLITDEFIHELMKVYRILKMPLGHLIIATPLYKSAKFLIKIASYLARDSVAHDLENGIINFNMHIAPSILRDTSSCFIIDPETMTDESLYEVSCLMNRNVYDLDIKNEMKEKLKLKFLTIGQESFNKENEPSSPALIKSKAVFNVENNQETIKIAELTTTIEQELNKIIIDSFNEYLHVVCCVNPYKSETIKFLTDHKSIVKHCQVVWYEFKNETLYSIGERMMEQLYENKQDSQKIMASCKIIYELLTNEEKDEADFLKFLGSCNRTYYISSEETNQRLNHLRDCLEASGKNLAKIEEQKGKSCEIQEKIEILMKKQEGISQRIKKIEEEDGEEDLLELENEMKKIKVEKDALDLKSRESRTFEKLCEDFYSLFPDKTELQKNINQTYEVKNKNVEYAVLVQSALFYLNNANKQQYIETFNKWMIALNLSPIQSIEDIMNIFENIYGIEYIHVPGWQRHSKFTQLKGIHFCENFMAIPESVFGCEPIVVEDDKSLLIELLSSLPEKNPSINVYSNCKLIAYLNESKERKCSREEILGIVEKEVDKFIHENKNEGKMDNIERSEDKLEFNKGIIMIGQNFAWKPSRNIIDIWEKKIMKEKKIKIENRIILQGNNHPNITFHADDQDLKTQLIDRSMKIEFGESLVNENQKADTFLREIKIKKDRKEQELIKTYSMNESQERLLEIIVKIQNDIVELERAKKKFSSIIPDEQKLPTDMFLIEWVIAEVGESGLIKFERVLEIYEFIKKCFMEINCSKEEKIKSIENIDFDVIKNWRNLIKANILNETDQSLVDPLKFLMPLQNIFNLILIQHEKGIENSLAKLLDNCSYTVHNLDMHLSIYENIPIDQQNKNLWVFHNFGGENQSHITHLLDHFERAESYCCPMIIIISNDCESIRLNELVSNTFNILYKFTVPAIPEPETECFNEEEIKLELKIKKETFSRLAKEKNKGLNEEISSGSDILEEPEVHDESLKFREALLKFITVMFKSKLKQENNLDMLTHSKFMASKISLVKSLNESKSFIMDTFKYLPLRWESLLLAYVQNNSEDKESLREVEEAITQLAESQINIKEHKDKEENVDKEYIVFPTIEEIDQRLSSLPFFFNFQDFEEAGITMNAELISKAHLFNERRTFLKKYLQECAKIIKGEKLPYQNKGNSFGFWLPSKIYINKMVSEYKILKKGLELAGLIVNIETSTKEIKLNMSTAPSQLQSVLAVSCQSFDCKNLSGISEKFLLEALAKAAKKLKVPIHKLKQEWKVVNSETTIEESVNGEVCICFDAKIHKKEFFSLQKAVLPKSASTIKLILLIYDPTPNIVTVHQVPKQSKKEKLKKQKQEQTKPQNNEKEEQEIGVLIKLNNGVNVASINLCLAEENMKLKSIIEEPYFTLF